MQTDPLVEETWSRIQDELGATFPDGGHQIWLSTLRPLRIDHSAIYVQAPRHSCDWVRRRFGFALSAAVRAGDPSLERVEILADEAATPAGAEGAVESYPSCPSFNRSFDSFVIGCGNHFAHAAALKVAELPGQSYNPLVLHGPAGVGKSHLLQAIGSYVTEHDADMQIQHTTTESFTTEFTRALRGDHIDDFKRTYREAELLLVDDLQFLAGKERTAEELLHTLEAALAGGAQVVITSDRHPAALDSVNSRLRERLHGGLVVDIAPAQLETRLAIVHKLATRFPDLATQGDVLDHLAHALPGNAHTLTGALTRLAAYISLTGHEVTPALTEQVLEHLYPSGATGVHAPSITSIQHVAATHFEVSEHDIRSAKRGRRLVYARQLTMYLCRELTTLSLPAIATEFGGRDHTTVLHAHRKVKGLLLTDGETRVAVHSLTAALDVGPQRHAQPDST